MSTATTGTTGDEISRYRNLRGVPGYIQKALMWAVAVLGILFILNVHIYLRMTVYNEQWVGIFLTLVLMITFLSVGASKRAPSNRVPWYDYVLCLLSLPAGLWLTINYPKVVMALGQVTTERIVFGALAIVLIAEAARRVIGLVLVALVVIFILYGAYSYLLPGMFAGAELTWGRLINYLYLDPNSMLDMLVLAATTGLAFIFFGQVLLKFGGGDALTNLALLLFGLTRGGSAKAAVVGSSLVGTVTGAPMSNVFLTGSITIPLMIRSGYPKNFAGAVEAVASSGGQIMPPVMGIAAFIIAERLGVPYATIALAALIPAILFYVAVFVQVDLEAGKRKLRGLRRAEMPDVKRTLAEVWPVIPVLAVLVYTIFIIRLSPAYAGVITGLVGIPLLCLRKENRTNFWRRFRETMEGTGKLSLDIVCALGVAGIVVGVISVSGLGFTIGYILTQLGSGGLIWLLLAAAAGSIVLGMGMPSVAAYSLVAVLVAPTLVEFGILPLAAHLFIFYFSIVSNFTPPIALAVFAAAAIAGTNPMRTGLTATRLGILSYIIPFLFVFSPSLLMIGPASEIVLSLITAVIGTVLLGAALTGYLLTDINWIGRILFLVSGVMLLIPLKGMDFTAYINLAGLILAAVLVVLHVIAHKRSKAELPETRLEA